MAISLESLKRGREIKPPRIVIYGVSGVGKTTFAAGANNPVFLPTEDGFGFLDCARFPLLKSWPELVEALKSLCESKHNYQTLVLDTLDRAEKLIFAQVCLDKAKVNIEDIGYAKGYVFALSYWEQLLSAFNFLREEKGMTILLTAHSLIKTFTPPDPGMDPYDVYRLDIHEKAGNMIKDWADVILFARPKVYTNLEGKDKVAKGVDTGERFIYTEERPSHWGKNRYGLPYELPFPKENAWQIFQDAMTQSIGE